MEKDFEVFNYFDATLSMYVEAFYIDERTFVK